VSFTCANTFTDVPVVSSGRPAVSLFSRPARSLHAALFPLLSGSVPTINYESVPAAESGYLSREVHVVRGSVEVGG